MNAKMEVRTGQAYASGGGRRRVDVEVLDWVATGRSKMLGGEVEFRLSGDERQPKSYVTAGQGKGVRGDFPAQLRFGMRYEVRTPRGTMNGLTGVAAGAISNFPPKAGDLFNIRKELQIAGVTVRPVACACALDASNVSLPR